MQEEAHGHHLNDLASLGAGKRRFEHGLMQLGIKNLSHRGIDGRNTVFGEDVGKLSQGEINAFDQSGCLGASFVAGGVKSALEVVVDRQKITGEFAAAVLFGFAPVTFGPFARVFGIGKRPHEAIAQLIALCAQCFEFVCCDVFFDFRRQVLLGGRVFLRHGRHPNLRVFGLAVAPFGQQLADQLGGVVDNRNDAAIIQPGRTDDAHRANDLSIRVHIGRNHQTGTRK